MAPKKAGEFLEVISNEDFSELCYFVVQCCLRGDGEWLEELGWLFSKKAVELLVRHIRSQTVTHWAQVISQQVIELVKCAFTSSERGHLRLP